jgi:Spy/CpxP family protein refolding chaperone
LSALLLFPFAPAASAQDETEAAPRQEQEEDAGRRRAPRRQADAAGLLLQLNLTPEQRAQLVEIRRQSIPEGQALTRRLNQARRALDEAIYADQVDEALIEELARQVGSAQSAVARMRALTELKVRRVLTPEQLGLFRQLRREAFIRQRLGRRGGRREGADGGGRRRRRDPLLDNRLHEGPAGDPTRSVPAPPPRTRRARP